MFDLQRAQQMTGLPAEQIYLLARTFLVEVQESAARLQALHAAADLEGIRRLAHMLKPSFYLMGVTDAHESIDYFLSLNRVPFDAAQLALQVSGFLASSRALQQQLEGVLAQPIGAVAI